MDGITTWLLGHWLLLLPLVLGGLALAWLLPGPPGRRRTPGAVTGIAALAAAGFGWFAPTGGALDDVLFLFFAGTAIAAAVCMVTTRSPVYAALWFAVTTLSVCGLFLLRSAPFLAAATVIVYAGAIIVTFLFVIMLARQTGSAPADNRSHQPLLATLTAFVLLGALLVPLRDHASGQAARARTAVAASATPVDASPAQGTMRGLGRTLFGPYLFAVELAGTLLLTAAIGAIAMAPRKSQEVS